MLPQQVFWFSTFGLLDFTVLGWWCNGARQVRRHASHHAGGIKNC